MWLQGFSGAPISVFVTFMSLECVGALGPVFVVFMFRHGITGFLRLSHAHAFCSLDLLCLVFAALAHSVSSSALSPFGFLLVAFPC